MKRSVVILICYLTAGMILAAPIDLHATTFSGPTPYLSFSDSPFSGLSFQYFYLEDFEDSLLNTPGVTASQGMIWPDRGYLDSVDADDGVIDGSGTKGKSWVVHDYAGFTFTFDESVLGKYPTHAGIVWTDAADPSSTSVYLEAFDVTGSSLGVFGPWTMGDTSDRGTTAEDRFLGVIDLDGISAIRIYQDAYQLEVDHLQYGFAAPVPEPTTMLLLASGLVGIAGVRKSLRKRHF